MMLGVLGGCQDSTMQLLVFSEQLLAHCYVFVATLSSCKHITMQLTVCSKVLASYCMVACEF